MRNTILRCFLMCISCLMYTQSKSQYIPALSSNINTHASSSYRTYGLSLNFKSLKIVSLAPSIELLYSTNIPNYFNSNSDVINSNLELMVPFTYSVKPFPKFSINNTLSVLVLGTSLVENSYYRLDLEYLLGNRFMINANYQKSIAFEYDMYGFGVSYLFKDYYKSSQKYYLKKRNQYNKKNGPGAFEKELEASLLSKDYYLGISTQADVNSWIFLNSISYSMGLNYQKEGFRGMMYRMRFVYSKTSAIVFASGTTYSFGAVAFVGEHRTNPKSHFFHGAELGILKDRYEDYILPIIGYKIGGGSGDNLLKKQLRIAGFFQINTLGPGLGVELDYYLKH